MLQEAIDLLAEADELHAFLRTLGEADWRRETTFQGWTPADTKWQDYDHQITPVPEPRIYGAALVLLMAGLPAWRRQRRASV